MKKLLLSYLLVVLGCSYSNAQSWKALGEGIPGYSHNWNFLLYAYSMVQYNGNLIVGGFFDSAGTTRANNIAQWNGSDWDTLGQGVKTYPVQWPNSAVFSELVYNNKLFVGGSILSSNMDWSGVVQWNGLKWDSVGPFGLFGYSQVFAMEVYNGNLYTAGRFTVNVGKLTYGIVQWNGKKWDSVSSGTQGAIYALTVYNGELYVCGNFESIGYVLAHNIAKWNDTNWSPVGSGIDSSVYALAVYDGKLYAGGYFRNAGGIPAKNIAVWNGISWDSLGRGITGINDYPQVAALTQYDSVLCVGGSFDSAGKLPVNNIACWNGSNWSAMGTGIRGHNKYEMAVFSIYSTSSGLYACGAFDSAGDVAAANIAVWSNVQTPIGEIATLKVYPNPNNGQFTVAINVNEICTIEMYNVLGQKLLNQMLQNSHGSNIINFPGEASEVYFYRVVGADGKIIGSGKMLVGK